MTRLGLGCMEVMYMEGATNSVFAKSVKELLKNGSIGKNFTYQSLYRTLSSLCQEGFVFYGAKAGKADTYFLTSKGIKLVSSFTED